MLRRLLPRLAVTLAIALIAALPGAAPAQGAPGAEEASVSARGPVAAYDRWKWFEDTYWIVPQRGIYSIYHLEESNRFVVVRGQTVFHITDYFNGYWTGAVVVKLSRKLVPSCQYVLGEVTPEGRVTMTMYDATDGSVVNEPVGTMVRKRGQWTMVNQMTNVVKGGTLSHWAYMMQSNPGSPTWNNLPFAHEPIPQFMSSCADGPTIHRGTTGQQPTSRR